MSTWLALTVLILDIVVIFVTGRRVGGVLGVILMIQSVYWALGYIARPIVLLAVRPVPRFGDPLAESRLASPSYEETIPQVLQPAVLGITLYVAIMVLVAWLLHRRASSGPPRYQVRLSHLAVLFALGWVFRAANVALGDNLTFTLAGVAAVAVGAVVLFSDRPFRPLLLGTLLLSELAWSVLTESKTPFLALALWILIRLISQRGLSRGVLLVMAMGLVVFFFIQDARVESGRLTSSDTYASSYPLWLQPILPLMARFDALQSSTDAWFAGPSSWIAPLAATGQWFTSLVPQFLLTDTKELAGAQWGQEVRRMSLNVDPGAALAEGPFSEGWVIGGVPGVVFGALFLAAAVVLVAAFLTSHHTPLVLMGLALTSAPLVFERGALGFGEGMGKGLQTTLVAGVVLFVLRLLERRNSDTRQSRQAGRYTPKAIADARVAPDEHVRSDAAG
jgi:hypothetical protein